MHRSKNPYVQEFLDELSESNKEKYAIVTGLRDIVFNEFTDVREKIKYGGIVFTLDEDFGGIFVYFEHVSFEFSKGARFDDPDDFLEGKGKVRRHIKISTFDDIVEKNVRSYVEQVR